MENITNDLWIEQIFPYVGDFQFRYVASVNRQFYTTYSTAFPKKRTSYTLYCTLQHVKISYPELPVTAPVWYPEGQLKALSMAASEKGHLDALRYLHPDGCLWLNEIGVSAARNGHFDMLKWAYLQGLSWDVYTVQNTMMHTTINGHLQILKWLCERGFPLDGSSTCYHAARNGHLDVLMWARSLGHRCHAHTLACAAGGGHLHIVKWLRDNGCPFDSWACALAAAGGHFEALKWLREHGFPWDEETCAGGHIDLVL